MPSAHGHPGLDEGIAQATAEILARPEATAPRLQRADLYRQHGQFEAALADLTAAEKRDSQLNVVMLARAEVFNDAGELTNALAAVDRFIGVGTNNSRAFILRARCEFKLQCVEGAIADYTRAVEKTPKPEPDIFLERARAQAALGRLAEAVKGLDEGMARLGAVPSLELAAIEYERQQGSFVAALGRVDKIIARHPVKEPWLVLRGEILAQAGRLAEGRDAFQQALAGIDNYPASRRNLDLTAQLQARAREGLARVERRLRLAGQQVSTPKY